ncbi:MAG: M15 family metallopeptidase, partial [Eubacterium sp.]
TGLAMDVTSDSVDYDLLESFADTAEGQWLAENAHKYGFIIRFPNGKTNITGYSYEPWHIRYVGTDTATKIYNANQCYEEYLEANKQN